MFKTVYGKQKLKRNFTQLSKCLGIFFCKWEIIPTTTIFLSVYCSDLKEKLFFLLFCSSIETTICVAYNFTAKISFKFVLTKQFHISFAMLFYYIYFITIYVCILCSVFSAEDKLKNNFQNLESLYVYMKTKKKKYRN